MKITGLIIGLLFLAAAQAAEIGDYVPESASKDAPGYAVVELFSSEGCSSCPTAEHFLNELAKYAEKKEIPIYTIAYHVDYWNKLRTKHGTWVDKYSSTLATIHQTFYINSKEATNGQKMGKFTPCFVVNGKVFRGLNPKRLKEALAERMTAKPEASLDIDASVDGRKLTVKYETKGGPKKGMLVLAVLESGIVSKITAGENHGKTLHHDNVARVHTFVRLSGDFSGEKVLTIPEDVNLENTKVVALLQEARTMKMFTVASTDISADDEQAKAETKDLKLPTMICTPEGCKPAPGAKTKVAEEGK